MRTRLAAWRVRRGLTQEELAALAGISRSKLIRLERGWQRTDMRVEDLGQLAVALGCSLTDLLEDEWVQWRNRNVDPEDLPTFWRTPDDRERQPQVAAPEARRELRRLFKELPAQVRIGSRLGPIERARASDMAREIHHAEVAAILEHDPDAADALWRKAKALRRAADLMKIVPPETR